MQKNVSPFVWMLALCATGLLGLAPTLMGAPPKRDPLPEVPPPAQPLAVKVPRGEPTDIFLRIYGRKNEDLKYLIRTDARHGRLTKPRVVEREVSVVTYTPPADLAVTRDRFSYAVQSVAGVSASVDVVITIVDQPPDLAIPGAQEFATILAGATAAKSVEITNRGGGMAEGTAAVEAPWRIDGATKYRIGAGERAVFKVVFAPETGGEFESAVRLSSQPEVSVPLRGKALAALAATPPKVVLQNAPGDPVRTGSFELSNQTDSERRVTLNGGERLRVPAELVVPAQGKVSVAVQSAAGDVAVLAGEVRVESAGFNLRVPVEAQRVGGIVRAAHPMVAFGRVDAAKGATGSFELENIGGAPASVSWEIAAPFSTAETSALLAPGERKTLAMRTLAAAPGKYRAWLAVTTEQGKLEIPVEAEVLAKLVVASPAVVREVVEVPPVESVAAEPEPVQLPAGLAELQVDLHRPAGVQITRLEATRATLEWPVALSAAAKFRFERRRLGISPSGELAVHWDEMPGVAVQRAGDRQVATLKNLQPGAAYGVRVVPAAEAARPLFTQYFTTPLKPSLWPEITAVRVLGVILAGCAFLIFRQRRADREGR